MNTSVSQKSLHAALDTIKKTLPVTPYTQLYLDARQGCLYLSATDTYLGTTVKLSAIVSEPGDALFPFGVFAAYIARCEEGVVKLTRGGGVLTVRVGRSTSHFSCYDSDTYTHAITTDNANLVAAFRMDIPLFRSVIGDVEFLAAPSNVAAGREFFACVLIKPTERGPHGLDVVASDGSSMAHRFIAQEHTLYQQMLIPAMALRNYLSILKTGGETVECFSGEKGNLVVFHSDNTDCFMRLNNVRYPLFNEIYPHITPFKTSFATKDLLAALLRSHAHNTLRVILDIAKAAMTVSITTELGGYEESIETVTENEETLRVAVPIMTVINALNHVNSDHTTVASDPHGKRRALVFSPTDERVRYPIMPLAR